MRNSYAIDYCFFRFARMVAFSPLRDRDAWSTIRGYVYQVDLTIQRWLELSPSQILELECGEDIDIISLALVAEVEERDRLLEQVKHRDGSLTLRSPEALTAIACFVEHIQSNPSANLAFQFTTNAKRIALQRKILERQESTDIDRADRQYQRLFWYVFDRLSKTGRKQLTPAELVDQLSLPNLTSDEQKTLDILKVWADGLDVCVVRLEQGQHKNSQAIANLGLDLKNLDSNYEIEGKVSYQLPSPVLDSHPLVSIHSLREDTVESFLGMVESSSWVAIDGSFGSGKTQLIALIVQQIIYRSPNVRCVWLRFRDPTTEQACKRFDQAIEILVEQSSTGDLGAWLGNLREHVDGNLVIVFDDLPQLSRGDELEVRLVALAQVCNDIGIRMLSSSSYQLPSHIQAVLTPPIVNPQKVPPFTNSEVTELLTAYGASEDFLSSVSANYIKNLAGSNPCLLVSIAEYLKSLNWPIANEVLFSLLKGEYAESINSETLDRLIAVQGTHSQELLYRLNLVVEHFLLDDVHALAGISPAVTRPSQHFHSLTGLWIQRDVGDRFFVSPLIKALGSRDLADDVRKDCHLTLGDRIA